MASIYAVRLNNEINQKRYDTLFKILPVDRQNKISRLRRKEDAVRTLVGDVLIRTLIKKYLSVNIDVITFNINKYGKPYMEMFPEFHFNLSHSGEWVVCAIDRFPIGIDVEKIKLTDCKVAEHFFTEKENHYLNSRSGRERIEGFFNLWTLKESYLKATGKGLSVPLNSFSILISDETGTAYIEQSYEEANYFLKLYELDDHHKCSLCITHINFPEKFIYVKLEDLL